MVRVDLELVEVDTLLSFSRPVSPWGRVQPTPEGRTRALMHAPILAPLSDGGFVTAWSDEAELQVRGSTGQPLMVVRRHEPNRDLTESQKQDYLDSLMGIWAHMFRMEGQPEHIVRAEVARGYDVYIPPDRLPAITGLMEGPEGTIWVRKPLPVEAMTSDVLYNRLAVREFWSSDWEVFSTDGTLLGDVSFPNGFLLTRIRGDFAYGIETDQDSDVQRIARYLIRRHWQ